MDVTGFFVPLKRERIPPTNQRGGIAAKRKQLSMEQIMAVSKQPEVGVPEAELIRKVQISEETLYRWEKQHTGLEVDQVRQLKQLQEENARLSRLVADLPWIRQCCRRCCQRNIEALVASVSAALSGPPVARSAALDPCLSASPHLATAP